MAKTILQKIIDREIPAKIEHEDEHCIVIHDIQPQAPVHVLIVPKKLIPRVAEAETADQAMLAVRAAEKALERTEAEPESIRSRAAAERARIEQPDSPMAKELIAAAVRAETIVAVAKADLLDS